ncbi:hypothetical protein PVAG01_03415 [Phlyctema vagabunda]|uniref:Uncharacterized protein n=1 Tax=Phlyctema vagabunda TaxID=108571 RepID=A0ABR4PLC9_9HELO
MDLQMDHLYIAPGLAGFLRNSPIGMGLPFYEEPATENRTQRVWELVAPYLDNASLCACSQVNSLLFSIFSRVIWFNPTATINAKQQASCADVIRFIQSAARRAETATLVNVLDFRQLPMISRKCGSQHRFLCEHASDWAFLEPRLSIFKNVRTLYLEGVKGFEEPRSEYLGFDGERIQVFDKPPSFKLRPTALSLANCDVYFRWLAQSDSLINLVYLDMSYTIPTQDLRFTLKVARFPNVRILKLRGLRLQDVDGLHIVSTFGSQLWSLDVAENQLTDIFMSHVARLALPTLVNGLEGRYTANGIPQYNYFDETPSYERAVMNPGPTDVYINDMVPMRPDDATGFSTYLSSRAQLNELQPLDPNDDVLQRTGLTQLYISDNRITNDGVAEILNGRLASRLQLFDVGTVPLSFPENIPPLPAARMVCYGIPCNYPLYGRSNLPRIEVLRIHHSVVTGLPTIYNSYFQLALPGSSEYQPDGRDSSKYFHDPRINSRIRDLTLTSVPRRSAGPIVKALIRFLDNCCCQERALGDYKAASTSRRSPKLLTGLRVLRIEFHPDLWNPQPGAGLSVSGDADVDAALAQGVGDFSFFEAGPSSPSQPSPTAGNQDLPPPYEPFAKDTRDVLEEVKRWRKSAESVWTGEISLVLMNA